MDNATLNGMFYRVILLNELDGDLALALHFSDPDGVRSGKSGWSYGVCQFDTKNNGQALACLKECGFTDAEVRGIVNQTLDVQPLAVKLQKNAAIVERYSTVQLSHCLNAAMNVITGHGVPMDNPGGILAAADVVNQYGSIGDGFVAFMAALDRPGTAADVLAWRLQTKYGREHPGDCKRRINNINQVIN